ncbi:MAG: hypothetical protein MSG64_12255 [Pyrinomonadaceae bacterium MAG19_C2-C3]|nr:hypothetical protein [Pyrinomonadaceae bacterium MAG19_C2-C3]
MAFQTQAQQPTTPGTRDGSPKKNVHIEDPKTVRTKGVIPNDVIIGVPEPIPYSRAFPLLDGLFQDVSAIQLSQLSLDANKANASNLDAITQQFQASFQYSQTLGLQNAAAAQQSAAYSASGALQTQLINHQTQLISLQLNAQQQVGQAQAALNALPTTATIDQRAAAQQVLTLANDNLTAISAQSANVKALMSASFTAPTFTAPAPTPIPFPSPPTISTPGGTDFAPSFPASKQMENHVNLLWERLAHLVNTLAQADHPNGISLVKFNIGIIGGKERRKHKLLSTQYSLTCSNKIVDNKNVGAPKIMDLFPRNAAVNITDKKYRNSRFGLGALLSFFSIGFNASYNREHLRITQALGQSAYITGFGIETNSFGWVFSPALGEDVIAPGDRTTFALVAAPTGCGKVSVNLINAAWDKSPSTMYAAWDDYDESKESEKPPIIKNLKVWEADPTPSLRCNSNCVERIAYTPAEFEPSNASPGAVTVNIKLKTALDREQTVSANGIILKRARDTFGRATGTGGSGGLLQATTLDAGTWIPVNSKELILNLNPAVFTRRFPSILLTSPNGTIDVTSQVSNATLEVAGLPYTCPSSANAPCASVLPAVGRPKAAAKHFAVARWKGRTNQFIITLPAAVLASANSSENAALPAVQVITDSRNQPWSAYAKVVAFQNGKNYPLQCKPLGERLLCEAGDSPDKQPHSEGGGQLAFDQPTEFEIFDADYAGTAVRGSGVLADCVSPCADPLVWEMSPPRWEPNQDQGLWNFHLSLINVEEGQSATLGPFSGDIKCTSMRQPCRVNIKINKDRFTAVTDEMHLQVRKRDGEKVGGSSVIGNLRAAISPILTYISDDQTRFSGQNLVFNKLQVGTSSNQIELTCVAAIDCSILGAGFGAKDEGYLYFVNGSTHVPLMLINDKGKQVVPPHKPSKPVAGGASASPSGGTNVTAPQTPAQMIQKSSERLYSIKQ